MDIATRAVENHAHYSACRHYRYDLVRRFAAGAGVANFIMLNPSTATEAFNDPTVARCETRTLAMGFGAMVVTNIFAYRATDPKVMRACPDPVGKENDERILRHARAADLVICAWGGHGAFMNRGAAVKAMLAQRGIRLHALRLTAAGEPSHPLYLPHALTPVVWE